MFIFTLLSTFLLLCCKIHHSNDEYNVFTNDWEGIFSTSLQRDQYWNYDIKYWMKSLQLEHCTLVEIGERFCAFCEDARLWTFRLPVVTSNWSQWLYPICNNNYEGQLLVVTSYYNQVTESLFCKDILGKKFNNSNKKDISSSLSIKLKTCFLIFLNTRGTLTTVQLTKLCLSVIECIRKDTHIYALKKSINNRQEIDEVYNNDYMVSPKDLKSMRSLRRRLLQSIGNECYGNMDYNTQRGKSNYRRYARYAAPLTSEDKDENENEDEDEDDDDYEVSDEKADDNFEEDEKENDEEEEEDNEFGHRNHGRRIRIGRSNRIGLSHVSKKQKEYLTKANVRIRSVTNECNEEPTEELQYYDYEASGIDGLFGNMHTLQIGYFPTLTAIYLLLTFII